MKKISTKIISKVATNSHKSDRKRLNYNYHSSDEKIQRMINVIQPDSYVRPHKHHNPDKVEVFISLQGKGLVICYNDNGQISDYAFISSEGPVKGVEIEPRIWHSIIALEKDSAFFEIIEGPYDKNTHKIFADWSPSEQKEGIAYIQKIKNKIKKWKKRKKY